MTTEEIKKRFTYHAPDTVQADKFVRLRREIKALASTIDELVPECREQSLAFTKLEEVMMWANAGIARNS